MLDEEAKLILIDFIHLVENEAKRIKTGHAPGPAMRDCLGQWLATVSEAKEVIRRYSDPEAQARP